MSLYYQAGAWERAPNEFQSKSEPGNEPSNKYESKSNSKPAGSQAPCLGTLVSDKKACWLISLLYESVSIKSVISNIYIPKLELGNEPLTSSSPNQSLGTSPRISMNLNQTRSLLVPKLIAWEPISQIKKLAG